MTYSRSRTTQTPIEKTRAEIEKLLRAEGVKQIQWSEDYEGRRIQLRFLLAVQDKDRLLRFEMNKRPMALIERDSIDKRTGRVSKMKLTRNIDTADRQVWRNLLDYLRILFTMANHGQLTFEEAFLHAFEIPGRNTTVGQVLIPQFSNMIAGKRFDLLALPDGGDDGEV